MNYDFDEMIGRPLPGLNQPILATNHCTTMIPSFGNHLMPLINAVDPEHVRKLKHAFTTEPIIGLHRPEEIEGARLVVCHFAWDDIRFHCFFDAQATFGHIRGHQSIKQILSDKKAPNPYATWLLVLLDRGLGAAGRPIRLHDPAFTLFRMLVRWQLSENPDPERAAAARRAYNEIFPDTESLRKHCEWFELDSTPTLN